MLRKAPIWHEGVAVPRFSAANPAMEQIIAQYDAHLQDAGGFAPATRLYRRRYAREFIQSVFGVKPARWERLRPAHIRSFIAGYGQVGHFSAAQVAAGSLRSFLRWLRLQGHTGIQLVAAVPRCPRWRLAGLPTAMTDRQLRAFLKTFKRSTPSGRRNYAMAVCMTDLGLRVGEVAALTLADLDESAGTLHLAAGKSRGPGAASARKGPASHHEVSSRPSRNERLTLVRPLSRAGWKRR